MDLPDKFDGPIFGEAYIWEGLIFRMLIGLHVFGGIYSGDALTGFSSIHSNVKI